MPKYTTEKLDRNYRSRAEGAEAKVVRVSPRDPRDETERYLRKLELTEHYDPIRETAGPTQ